MKRISANPQAKEWLEELWRAKSKKKRYLRIFLCYLGIAAGVQVCVFTQLVASWLSIILCYILCVCVCVCMCAYVLHTQYVLKKQVRVREYIWRW